MSVNKYYKQCCGGIGRPVRIRTVDGRVHTGVIDRVTNSRVYLRPMGGRPAGRNYGGFAYDGEHDYGGHSYGWRGGYGWGWGAFGAGIALGAIATLAFIPWFVW